MGFDELARPFSWALYSKKLKRRIDSPRNVGAFSKEGAEARGMRLAFGKAGAAEEGNLLLLYWLVDPEDGGIVDSKFQLFGQTALIGAADAACGLLVGKNYDQARRLGADLIDRQLRDHADKPAFPRETYSHLNLVVEAIERASESCEGLPLPSGYSAPPAPLLEGEEGPYPGWLELTREERLALIEQVFDSDLRPYIALDGGGVEVVDLIGEFELKIAYQGNCTSCFSAAGATLSYIQQVMRRRIHPEMCILPEF